MVVAVCACVVSGWENVKEESYINVKEELYDSFFADGC